MPPDTPKVTANTSGTPGRHGRRVAVLIAVYNGDRFLREQIETLAKQDVAHLDLWFADDGSTDRTRDIVEETRARWTKGEVHLLPGPRQGFAENFRHLLVHPDIDADHVALCDQDDLWEADKLSSAIARLDAETGGETGTGAGEIPALHCSRTRIVAEDGTPIGHSRLFARPPSFRNAIVQNIAGGNTMVMNRAAHRLIRQMSRDVSFVSHDWWCYLLVAGMGGKVLYSPEAKTSYRQHAANVVGENVSLRARFFRVRMVGKGRYRSWNEINLAALAACRERMTPDARRTLDLYGRARRGWVGARLVALMRSGVYRQTPAGQVGLYLACVLNRI